MADLDVVNCVGRVTTGYPVLVDGGIGPSHTLSLQLARISSLVP
jgi:hypothetical protein